VKCPKCGAEPGRPCIGARKSPQKRKSPHAQRMALASATVGAIVRPANNLWAILRAQVFAKKGASCFYCGSEASHVDHKTPLSRSGTNDIENLVPCCVSCNIAKGSMTAQEFMK